MKFKKQLNIYRVEDAQHTIFETPYGTQLPLRVATSYELNLLGSDV